MKTQIVKIATLICLAITSTTFAQEAQKNSEVKLNVLGSLAGFVEGSYEHILSDESAVGLSLGVAYDEDIYFNYAVTPYYRFYFGKKRAAGFFAEGSASLYSQEVNSLVVVNDVQVEQDDATGAGLGVAVGFKLLTNSNWLFEIYAGAGRNFLNDDRLDVAYPRFGLQIGKRF